MSAISAPCFSSVLKRNSQDPGDLFDSGVSSSLHASISPLRCLTVPPLFVSGRPDLPASSLIADRVVESLVTRRREHDIMQFISLFKGDEMTGKIAAVDS